MFVLRKTMERNLREQTVQHQEERGRFYAQYGEALRQTAALQQQLAAWITEKADSFTPEQMADLFYSHDDSWQAAFFNAMQARVQAAHDAMPPKLPNEYRPGPGYPAGEGQWCWMAGKLDDSGFETIEAMYEHAKSARERRDETERAA